jgi:hypothetical protein
VGVLWELNRLRSFGGSLAAQLRETYFLELIYYVYLVYEKHHNMSPSNQILDTGFVVNLVKGSA